MSARRDIYYPDRRTARADEEPPKLKRSYKIMIWCGIILAFFAGGAYLSRIPALQIKNIVIEGNSVVSSEAISAIVEEDISGFYFFFFPKTNIFWYPEGRIEKDLRVAFPRLSQVHAKRALNRDLKIAVSEYTTKYLLCSGETFDLPCYAVDAVGHVFDTAPRYSGGIIFPFSAASSTGVMATSSPIGETFLSPDELVRVIDIKDAATKLFQKNGLPLSPNGVLLTVDHDYRLIFKSGDRETDLLFKDGRAEDLGDSLELVLATPKFERELSEKGVSKLAYIDLRFIPKVYYSFAGSTTTVAK
jgi:hypothetical protein